MTRIVRDEEVIGRAQDDPVDDLPPEQADRNEHQRGEPHRQDEPVRQHPAFGEEIEPRSQPVQEHHPEDHRVGRRAGNAEVQRSGTIEPATMTLLLDFRRDQPLRIALAEGLGRLRGPLRLVIGDEARDAAAAPGIT